MAEYIEREAFRQLLVDRQTTTNFFDNTKRNEDGCIIDLLDKFSAADVAPVRHGRWEAMHYEGGILDGTNFDKCSVCGYKRIFEDEKLKIAFKYCPNCGAKMDGDDNA